MSDNNTDHSVTSWKTSPFYQAGEDSVHELNKALESWVAPSSCKTEQERKLALIEFKSHQAETELAYRESLGDNRVEYEAGRLKTNLGQIKKQGTAGFPTDPPYSRAPTDDNQTPNPTAKDDDSDNNTVRG